MILSVFIFFFLYILFADIFFYLRLSLKENYFVHFIPIVSSLKILFIKEDFIPPHNENRKIYIAIPIVFFLLSLLISWYILFFSNRINVGIIIFILITLFFTIVSSLMLEGDFLTTAKKVNIILKFSLSLSALLLMLSFIHELKNNPIHFSPFLSIALILSLIGFFFAIISFTHSGFSLIEEIHYTSFFNYIFIWAFHGLSLSLYTFFSMAFVSRKPYIILLMIIIFSLIEKFVKPTFKFFLFFIFLPFCLSLILQVISLIA